MTTFERADFQTNQEVRWCPGCGDYTILATVQNYLATLDIPRENHVFVSGIGCAARFPYYVETYGMHSIHGRAPAIASGIAATRPELSVWVVTGDGDALSIGGNHLIHALRRNLNITILLFNNQIYGLTKGQYSPTSETGKRTKSSPMGAIEYPFNPVSVALGAEATFVARTIDMDRDHSSEVIRRAHEHKGSALVEIYQNCNVFNDKAFIQITGKEERTINRINLAHDEPIIFGAADDKAVVMKEGAASIVDLADVDPADVHIHNEFAASPAAAFSLSRLSHGPYGPTPVGVFRAFERDDYSEMLDHQILDAQSKKGPGDLLDLVSQNGTWQVQ